MLRQLFYSAILLFITGQTSYATDQQIKLKWSLHDNKPINYEITLSHDNQKSAIFYPKLLKSILRIQRRDENNFSVEVVIDEFSSPSEIIIHPKSVLQTQGQLKRFLMRRSGEIKTIINASGNDISIPDFTEYFYILDAIIFELPNTPINIGKKWPISGSCLDSAFYDAEFFSNTSVVTLSKITTNKKHEQIAHLNYNYLEHYNPNNTVVHTLASASCKYIGLHRFNITLGELETINGIITLIYPDYLRLPKTFKFTVRRTQKEIPTALVKNERLKIISEGGGHEQILQNIMPKK